MSKAKTPPPEVRVPQIAGKRLLPIDEVIPYWRNPRDVTDSDIAKVMRSIETYGYQAPIIVDDNNVIIAGHTRYLALRRLGWTEIPVLVSDLSQHEAKEYRIIDNRAAELTAWDREKLLGELQRFENRSMLGVFFPEIDFELGMATLDESMLLPPLEEPLPSRPAATASRECICPHCYHSFELAKKGPSDVDE